MQVIAAAPAGGVPAELVPAVPAVALQAVTPVVPVVPAPAPAPLEAVFVILWDI